MTDEIYVDQEKLIPVWTQLMAIYGEIIKICERHQLRVFGVYGTALGAVRHRGFIPWDDDLDLGMPRGDYEMFLDIACKELPSWLSIVTWKNDPNYKLLFSKVIVTNRALTKSIVESVGLKLPQGLFVDIFPYDGCSGLAYKEMLRTAKKAIYKIGNYYFDSDFKLGTVWIKHIVGYLVVKALRVKSLKELLAKEERLARSYEFDVSKYVNTLMFVKNYFQVLKFDLKGIPFIMPCNFGEGRFLPFNTSSIVVPSDVEHVLTLWYGDYMQLPPKELRVPMHSISDIAVSEWRFGPNRFSNKPLVSIVIANYNYGRFLEDAITSVVDQCLSVAKGAFGQNVLTLESGDVVELIICDGGSSDESLSIIQKYSEKLAWWESKKDRGQSHAFNKGFSHANGHLLTWLNADDMMVPGSLIRLAKAARRNPKCEWFIGGCYWANENLKIVKATRARKIQDHVAKSGFVPVYSPSSFFSKHLLEAVGGVNEAFHYKMDTVLWLQFYHELNARPAVLGGHYFCLRMHPGAKVSGVEYYGGKSPPQHLRETEWINERWPIKKISRIRQLFAIDSYKLVMNMFETMWLKNKDFKARLRK